MKSIDIDKVVKLRDQLGKTQEETAKALDMGRTTYLSREKKGDFSNGEVIKLAAFLGVQPEDLYKNDIKIEDAISLLLEKSIRTESLTTAVLVGIAKILEAQNGEPAAKILEDLVRVSDRRSSDFANELARLVKG